jgi:hypothetical protein
MIEFSLHWFPYWAGLDYRHHPLTGHQLRLGFIVICFDAQQRTPLP